MLLLIRFETNLNRLIERRRLTNHQISKPIARPAAVIIKLADTSTTRRFNRHFIGLAVFFKVTRAAKQAKVCFAQLAAGLF